jgi:hypothetical protein
MLRVEIDFLSRVGSRVDEGSYLACSFLSFIEICEVLGFVGLAGTPWAGDPHQFALPYPDEETIAAAVGADFQRVVKFLGCHFQVQKHLPGDASGLIASKIAQAQRTSLVIQIPR